MNLFIILIYWIIKQKSKSLKWWKTTTISNALSQFSILMKFTVCSCKSSTGHGPTVVSVVVKLLTQYQLWLCRSFSLSLARGFHWLVTSLNPVVQLQEKMSCSKCSSCIRREAANRMQPWFSSVRRQTGCSLDVHEFGGNLAAAPVQATPSFWQGQSFWEHCPLFFVQHDKKHPFWGLGERGGRSMSAALVCWQELARAAQRRHLWSLKGAPAPQWELAENEFSWTLDT